MNTTQLRKLGVPDECLTSAITGLQSAIGTGGMRGKDVKARLKQILDAPGDFTDDPHFGEFASNLIETRSFVRPDPIVYRTWGSDIDDAAHAQMRQACAVPMARGAALMPDAHVGYGLPIGGVLALDGAVIPYAVGVDIACRMKLSVLDTPPETLTGRFDAYKTALEGGTRLASARSMRSRRPMRCWTRTGRSPASLASTRTKPGGSSARPARATTSSSSVC